MDGERHNGRRVSTFETPEASLTEAGMTVFQSLFTIALYLPLFANLPGLAVKAEDLEETEGFA